MPPCNKGKGFQDESEREGGEKGCRVLVFKEEGRRVPKAYEIESRFD